MSEAEGEDPTTVLPEPPAKETTSVEREFMDLDLDLDPSWPFDPNPFGSDPSSPFLFSFSSSPLQNPSQLQPPFSDQPSSPLWIFPDAAADDKSADYAVPTFSGGFRLTAAAAECPKHMLSRNPHPINGKSMDDRMKIRLPPGATTAVMDDEDSDGSCMIKERMTQALRYFKESTEQHVLVQVWAPVKSGDRYVLTTSGQPFVLDPQSTGLLQYRTVSLMYIFSVDGESDGDLGLPGRVFRQKLPEWTPNVQYYSSKEYPRLNHALHYNVRGTLALPVFEPSGQSCVGVVELIMTAQKINYAPEVDKVCKALEAVNLKSSEILAHPSRQICNAGRQAALAEILEILTVVCETHKLPLAQTWVPCRHRSVLAYGGGSKKSCTSFDGSCMGQVSMSTTDVASYVVDAHMWGFRDACAEHHLQKGQGVAGQAFALRKPCFSRDITQFGKTEYPLVHYARMFGLMSCLAVCLQSTHTGSDDYILEFFLPPNCRDSKEQEDLLNCLSTTMKQCFRSLNFTGKEPQEGSLEIMEPPIIERPSSEVKHIPIQSSGNHLHTSSFTKPFLVLDDIGIESLQVEDVIPDLMKQRCLTEVDAQRNDSKLKKADGSPTIAPLSDGKNLRTCERKRGKTEKSISLEVLQQYFAGSLKDAAKSLGVCPTTMKRICRQHGISRWPSRKINKVNRSLSKLKRVIESVQGAEGSFSLASITSPLPIAVGSITRPVNLQGSKQQPAGTKPSDLEVGREKESINSKMPESVDIGDKGDTFLGGRLIAHQELAQEDSGSQPELCKGSDGSKTASGSGGESTDNPTSQDSCHGSPTNEPHLNNPCVSAIEEQGMNINGPMGLTFPSSGTFHQSATYSLPDALMAIRSPELLSGRLVEDSGSCKDFRDLCSSAAECCQDERAPESSWTNPPCSEPIQQLARPALTHTLPFGTSIQNVRTATIKATYKEDIIRFRLPFSFGVFELNEEVSKRLKLDMGTFDIKYLDDDHEWVLLSCDADLQECMEISTSSGGHVIRLSVHDIVANFGSSCESSGE
eukprot:TRINITY_DN16280_c0_g1_i1.p1 TRINITY_DN16280_c0_g1~~TRINITY_DN16280_c0_g1_i1.p1  ORF type:complete len:1032 (-),score=207.98 TRINITY_DN16280_c0_g1_i1:349-3444(-)